MDAFWTAEEAACRRAARAHFGRRRGLGRDAAPEIPSGLGLAGRAGIVEEAAVHDPKLGGAMAEAAGSSVPPGPAAAAVIRSSLLAGTAAHVLGAGLRAAREKGAFASSLMGCRETQDSLAGLLAGAELMRLGAWRLCRLLERRETALADAEALRLLARGRAFAADVRAAALSLLGPAWVAEHLPEDDLIPADERRTP